MTGSSILTMSTMAFMMAFVVGCASHNGHVKLPENVPVIVKSVQASRPGEALLRASVQVKNEANTPLRLHYRFLWLDAAGKQVGAETPSDCVFWVSLAPYETRRIQGDAPSSEIVDFRLDVQSVD